MLYLLLLLAVNTQKHETPMIIRYAYEKSSANYNSSHEQGE
jgi:hypothetical protein